MQKSIIQCQANLDQDRAALREYFEKVSATEAGQAAFQTFNRYVVRGDAVEFEAFLNIQEPELRKEMLRVTIWAARIGFMQLFLEIGLEEENDS